MTGRAGSLFVLAGECLPAEALAAAAPWIPRGWDVVAELTPWGTALTAGPAMLHENDLIVIGTPVADPWGIPRAPLDRQDVATRYRRYHDGVAQLVAGPFAVCDLRQGSVVSALNGIVPVFTSRGRRSVIGCHSGAVAALAKVRVARLAPRGCSITLAGTLSDAARFPPCESLPLMSVAGVEAEIELRIRRAGPPRPIRPGRFSPTPGRLRLHHLDDALMVSTPPGRIGKARDASAALERFRESVCELWWQAGLRGIAVFAPILERPATDALSQTARAAG